MKLINLIISALIIFFSISAYSASNEHLTVTQHLMQTNEPNNNKPLPETTYKNPMSNENDALITKSIQEQLRASKNLSPLPVTIKTENGVVNIRGKVNSVSQATTIVEIAESVMGVNDVDASKLTIKESNKPLEDIMITAKVKGLFIREKLFGTKDISAINVNVETNNGTVYLTGVVDNDQQIKHAIDLIEKYVKGVKKVEYNIDKKLPTTNPTLQ